MYIKRPVVSSFISLHQFSESISGGGDRDQKIEHCQNCLFCSMYSSADVYTGIRCHGMKAKGLLSMLKYQRFLMSGCQDMDF